MGVSHQAGHGFQSARFRHTGFHQDHRSGGIIDAGGVARGHRAVFFQKYGPKFGHVCGCAIGAEMFVDLKGHVPFFALEHHGHDLGFEVTSFGGTLGPVVAFDRNRVLLFAGDAPFGRNILCRDAHVNRFKRVMQRANHHVDHFGVAHASAPTGAQTGVGSTAHVLGAAANGNVGVTQQNTLAGRHNGLQA